MASSYVELLNRVYSVARKEVRRAVYQARARDGRLGRDGCGRGVADDEHAPMIAPLRANGESNPIVASVFGTLASMVAASELLNPAGLLCKAGIEKV